MPEEEIPRGGFVATANQQKYRAALHLTEWYSLAGLPDASTGVVARYISLDFNLPSSAHLDLAIAGV